MRCAGIFCGNSRCAGLPGYRPRPSSRRSGGNRSAPPVARQRRDRSGRHAVAEWPFHSSTAGGSPAADPRHICSGERLSWVEDPSNLDPVFTRNRLRHEVLPLLAEIQSAHRGTLWPGLRPARAAEEDFWREQAEKALPSLASCSGRGDACLDCRQCLRCTRPCGRELFGRPCSGSAVICALLPPAHVELIEDLLQRQAPARRSCTFPAPGSVVVTRAVVAPRPAAPYLRRPNGYSSTDRGLFKSPAVPAGELWGGGRGEDATRCGIRSAAMLLFLCVCDIFAPAIVFARRVWRAEKTKGSFYRSEARSGNPAAF